MQRPLWASTSTKNPAYPDTLYVDELIGPDTVNTLPESTMQASRTTAPWPARSTPASRRPSTSCARLATSASTWTTSASTLENQGIAGFQESFTHVLGTLRAKAHAISVAG